LLQLTGGLGHRKVLDQFPRPASVYFAAILAANKSKDDFAAF
jgi:hypothetical protein